MYDNLTSEREKRAEKLLAAQHAHAKAAKELSDAKERFRQLEHAERMAPTQP